MKNVISFILIIACLAISKSQGETPEKPIPETGHFVCPPCGCEQDGVLFEYQGNCKACGMPLIAQPVGFKKEVSELIRPTYLHSSEIQLFPKILYPAFFTGIFFGLMVLLAGRKRRIFNPYLGLLILCVALYGFKFQLYGQSYGYFDTPVVIFLPLSFIIALGPLLFLYTKSIFESSFKFKKAYWLHFIPAGLVFLWYTITLALGGAHQPEFMMSPFEVKISHFEQICAVVLGFAYLYASFKIYRKWRNTHAISNYIFDGWMLRFHIGFLMLFSVWACLIFINFWLYDFGVTTGSYFILWIACALFIYWIYIEILIRPKFFLINRHLKISNGHVSLTKQELEEFKSRLLHVMNEEKPYLNPKLSLSELANYLDTNPKYLSMILNNELQKNFYEFINAYRILEVKNLLRDPEHTHLTIEAIAQMAGFQSKSSFNTLFKKHTQMTPRDYLKSLAWE